MVFATASPFVEEVCKVQTLMIIWGCGKSSRATSLFRSATAASSPGTASWNKSVSVPIPLTVGAVGEDVVPVAGVAAPPAAVGVPAGALAPEPPGVEPGEEPEGEEVPVDEVGPPEPPELPPAAGGLEPPPPVVGGLVPVEVVPDPVEEAAPPAAEVPPCEPEEPEGGELEPGADPLDPNAPVISEALRKKSLSTGFSARGFHAKSRRSLRNAVSSTQAGMVLLVIRTFDDPTS